MADDPDEPPLITDFGEVTIPRLEQAVKDAALIVEVYGDDYRIFLDRMTRELEQARRVEEAYGRAMAYPTGQN